MAPLIFPLLELAAKFIPQIAANFGSGSEVSNRNLAAGNQIAAAIVEAVKPGSNLQAAVEEMQGNPDAVKAANAAVADLWPSIYETGGGGIKGAREGNVAAAGVPLWKNAAFVMGLLFFLLVAYVVILSMLKFSWIADITAETRAGVIMFVLGTIGGGLVGYFYGTTSGSQRKTDLLSGAK